MDVTKRVIQERAGFWKYEITYRGLTLEAEIAPHLDNRPGYLLTLARPGWKRTRHRRRQPTIFGALFPTQEAALQGAEDWMRTRIHPDPKGEQDAE